MKFDCRIPRALMMPRVSDFPFKEAQEIYCQQRILDDIMERIYDNSCRKIGCAKFKMRDGKTFSAIYNELKSLGYDVEYEKEPLEDGVLVKMKIMW